jgi:hypothetical protein
MGFLDLRGRSLVVCRLSGLRFTNAVNLLILISVSHQDRSVRMLFQFTKLNWLKIKTCERQEVVIAGVTAPTSGSEIHGMDKLR